MTILGTANPDILKGTEGDDSIASLGGDDTIIASAGKDLIADPSFDRSNDTLNLEDLGVPVTANIATELYKVSFLNTIPKVGALINSSVGETDARSIEVFIAPEGQINTIDESIPGDRFSFNTPSTLGAFDIDLQKERVSDFSQGMEETPIVSTFKNFSNVIGSIGSDTITGNSDNNSLTGNTGNDKLNGKDGDDTLLGTSAESKGAYESDTLTGGVGADRFILGDTNGAYYKADGNNDFTKINDFGSGDLIQLGTNETYTTVRKDTGFNLLLTTSGTKELIASVKTSSLGSSDAANVSPEDILSNLPVGNFQIESGETLGIFMGA